MADKSRRQRLEEMLAEDPTDSFCRYGLAMDYASAGEDETAAKVFAELLRMSPEYVPAYLQAGQVLARLGARTRRRQFIAPAWRWPNAWAMLMRRANCRGFWRC